jgi:hypothetical protein
VTKRLVNPLLQGWARNVMDFHPSSHMFFVKARDPDAAPDPAVEEAHADEP